MKKLFLLIVGILLSQPLFAESCSDSSIGGIAPCGHTIKTETGTTVNHRKYLQFTGSGVSSVLNSATNTTVVTITGGTGDITKVGDCSTGDCFDGTTGTSLTFNNAGGDGILSYDGTDFNLDKSFTLGTAGVRLSGDGDGAITLIGLGNGADEDLTLNLDDTANTGVITSSTGLNVVNFSSIALQESGLAVLNNDEIDASAELAAIMDDETGSGALMFGTTPTITTSANFGTAGVRLSDDGDGALTFLGLGDGSDENLTMNLDDTSNTVDFTSSTGLTTWRLTDITSLTLDSATSCNLSLDRGATLANAAQLTWRTAGTNAFQLGIGSYYTNSNTILSLVSSSGGIELAGFNTFGDFWVTGDSTVYGGDFTVTGSTTFVSATTTMTHTGTLSATSGGATRTPLVVKGAASQSAPLFVLTDSNNAVTTQISNSGSLTVRGSDVMKRTIVLPISNTITAPTVTSGQNCAGDLSYQVDSTFNNFKVTTVVANVSSPSTSGAITLNLRNRTDGVDVLSTALTIDANERSSTTAATPAVINLANATITTDDDICAQVSGAGTGASGLQLSIGIQQ